MTVLVLFVAPDDRLHGWWLVDGGKVTARGVADTPLPDDTPERVVLVAPADAMTVHVAELGALSTEQARAAARLLAADTSAVPIETQHVAVGRADGADRAVAVTGAGRIAAWLGPLQARGLDPDMILAAPLLLPRPESGFLRAVVGGETVLRGRGTAFADADGLTPLLIGEESMEDVDGEAAILSALADPELDLRQGAFARRNRFRIDWALARRLALLGGALAAVTLLIAVVQIARYSWDAGRIDAEAQAVARAAVPDAGPDAASALRARLSARRGGGYGFTATAGALAAAIQAVPNVELASLDFDADGLLRATILAPGQAEAETLRDRLKTTGLAVEATPFQAENGRIRGEFRIGGR